MKKPFKLKYKNSAFPFKGSPVKELQTESGESVVEVDNEGSEVEQENIETAKKTLKNIRPSSDLTTMLSDANIKVGSEKSERKGLFPTFERPESKTPKWTGWMSV